MIDHVTVAYENSENLLRHIRNLFVTLSVVALIARLSPTSPPELASLQFIPQRRQQQYRNRPPTYTHFHPLSMASGSIAELMTDEEYKQKVENSVEPVVVTFLSALDDKCKAVVSKIEEMSDEYPNIKFYLVDVRKHAMLSRALSNRGLPIVAFVKNDGIYVKGVYLLAVLQYVWIMTRLSPPYTRTLTPNTPGELVSLRYRTGLDGSLLAHRSPPDPVAASVVRIFQQSRITQSAAVEGPGDSQVGGQMPRSCSRGENQALNQMFVCHETVIEDTDEHKIIQLYTPLGVCGVVVLWNFPVLLAVGKIIPAVYRGSTVIVKPSPFTPYCGLKLAELAAQCFPPGVVQALSGGDDLGPMITEHPGIDKISFTRSTLTGKRVTASCAQTLKRVTRELGRNDPAIIYRDPLLPLLGPDLHDGQVTVRPRGDLLAFVGSLNVGDGTEADVFFGPVQNSMQYDKAKNLLGSFSKEGLTTALYGNIQDSAGYFIHPTMSITLRSHPGSTGRAVHADPPDAQVVG
ncbi:hypothetical protein CFD26_100527 [Aspergillus turcosus]|uniref:aldehyde dehydrogenase (NAD(+)) n=1 Tax=Aspergillus turcosus TaxID=1245748 RepID=A0A421D5Z8_9EURO|nr:hypothetical protein CFD26_100527 [Aspergillus turcosus]